MANVGRVTWREAQDNVVPAKVVDQNSTADKVFQLVIDKDRRRTDQP
ncbi:MAG: hypothetical protein P8J37_04870 [Fuerstiella sp.]|nr:hypothetical protein [Fuerstiella sp.]